MTTCSILVCPAGADRSDDLLDVIAASFEAGASDYWVAGDVAGVLARENCFAYCAAPTLEGDGAGGILGFIVARVVGGEAEILSLAVMPESRRSGIARALIGAALSDHRARQAGEWSLAVGADNRPALALYRSMGFAEAGRRPEYYRTPGGARKDALTMRLEVKSQVLPEK